LFINGAEPSLSSAHVWVDLASIDTADPERDAHVLSPEFFDVAQFPRAEFESTDVRIEDEQVIIEGRLALHGAVCDVELRAVLGPASTGSDGRQRRRCTARGTLDRQSFGLHWNQDVDVGGGVVGDEVEIAGEVELVLRDE
jgi:polyisoprenoid-binding protein YceI